MTMMEKIKRHVSQPLNIVLFRKGRTVSEHDLLGFFTNPKFEYLHKIHEFAIFSHAVYGEITAKYARDGDVMLDIPKNWETMKNLSSVPEKVGSLDLSGLRYHVWQNLSENKVVIAFRGTRGANLTDWFANANFISRFVPKVRNHYGKVKDFIPGFVDEIRSRFDSNVEIISTGHSLGGGLAQLAAYMSPHINNVFAFNSSPVTGYRSIDKNILEINKKDTHIARIFEHGEILAYVRFFLKKFVTLSTSAPEINEVRFNFSQSNAISEHSMGRLAEHIINESPNADSTIVAEDIA